MAEDRTKLGCIGWVAAVLVISWPLHVIGLSDTAAIVGGLDPAVHGEAT